MTKVIRYERPSLEVEFDQQALTAQGYCRFVIAQQTGHQWLHGFKRVVTPAEPQPKDRE